MDGAGKGISRRGQPFAKGRRLPELSLGQAPAVRPYRWASAAQAQDPGTRVNRNQPGRWRE